MRMNLFSGALRCAFFFASILSALGQGSLTPQPGLPAPTMKTLDQIDAKLEKRKPIDDLNTPGDATARYVITARGPYYLPGLTFGGGSKHGIKIAVDDVTIDLNGFTLDGANAAGNLIGIIASVAQSKIRIRNGMIRGFSGGAIETQERNYLRMKDESIDAFGHLQVRSSWALGESDPPPLGDNGSLARALSR